MSLVVKRPDGRYNLRFGPVQKQKKQTKKKQHQRQYFCGGVEIERSRRRVSRKELVGVFSPLFSFFPFFFVPPTKRSLVGIWKSKKAKTERRPKNQIIKNRVL